MTSASGVLVMRRPYSSPTHPLLIPCSFPTLPHWSQWFRFHLGFTSHQDFPYYYDACLSCGNRENNTFVGYVSPTEDERTFKAGRTELYHCSSCGALSRFARYTAVSKASDGAVE